MECCSRFRERERGREERERGREYECVFINVFSLWFNNFCQISTAVLMVYRTKDFYKRLHCIQRDLMIPFGSFLLLLSFLFLQLVVLHNWLDLWMKFPAFGDYRICANLRGLIALKFSLFIYFNFLATSVLLRIYSWDYL